MKKHKANALEFSFAADAFNLELVTTEDGDRQAAEARQRELDRQAAANQQSTNSELPPHHEPHR